MSFPVADVPFFNTGGPVDMSAHQSGNVWFLAGANYGLTSPRSGVVPAGKSLFLAMANYLNDYPCPAAFGFEPLPGESLHDFLSRTGQVPYFTNLFCEIDGVPVAHLEDYRAESPLFYFQSDVSFNVWDPCITGSLQPGLTTGYWLLIPPLTPGAHTIHFGAPDWGQNVTYNLTVMP
ncbi:MAG: hypothetical protein IPJ58_05160 [Ardenticatenia bacterium]|nr:hypothetical protein [Ardenticatenia bacterium]